MFEDSNGEDALWERLEGLPAGVQAAFERKATPWTVEKHRASGKSGVCERLRAAGVAKKLGAAVSNGARAL